jgi:glycosyltransferase involved in cell wall biosynthesis
MTTSPTYKLSVLIRTRDRQEPLKRAISSVMVQEIDNLELLVINDRGSSVKKLCEKLLAQDKKTDLKVIDILPEQQGGRSHAANLGLKFAQGEFVAFLDDDDWLMPGHYTKLLSALEENTTFSLAYSGVICENSLGEKVQVYDEPVDEYSLMLKNALPIHAPVFRRQLLESGCLFNEDINFYEDWDFWLQLAEQTSFLHVPGITAVYYLGLSGFAKRLDEEQSQAEKKLLSQWLKRWPIEKIQALFYQTRELSNKAQWHKNDLSLLDKCRTDFACLSVEREKLITDRNLILKKHDATEKQLHQTQRDYKHLDNQYSVSLAEKEKLEIDINIASSQIQQLNKRIDSIYSSYSWRLTKPLRWLSNLLN